jgi:hypothetical protein
MNREIKDIATWAASQGWRVEDDANGYTRFHDPAGTYVTRYPPQATLDAGWPT